MTPQSIVSNVKLASERKNIGFYPYTLYLPDTALELQKSLVRIQPE